MKKISARLFAVALFFFFHTFMCVALPPAIAKKIPGQFFGHVEKGLQHELQATRAGKYLFQYRRHNAEKKPATVFKSTTFANDVKIVLRNSAGTELATNYYPAEKRHPIPHYSDYFAVDLQEPQLLLLELSPLSAEATAQSFSLAVDFTAFPTMVMGMELSKFLSMVFSIVFLIGTFFFCRYAIKLLKGMNVQEVVEKGEKLRAARRQAAASPGDLTEAPSFCGKCGLPREAGADFCGECGARFED